MASDRATTALFDRVVLVFNPAKAGMADRITALQRELAAALPDLQIDLLDIHREGEFRATAWQARAMARNPEPHTKLTVIAGTASGSPAANAAWRAGFMPCPACRTLPSTTSST